jgi:hypothetical protein
MTDLVEWHEARTPEHAGQFAGAAAGAWCPQDGPDGDAADDNS